LNPGNSFLWYRLGLEVDFDKNLDLATKAFAAAVSLDPNNFRARRWFAECLIKQGLLAKATVELEIAEVIAKENKVDQIELDKISEIRAELLSKFTF
jgi:cytochrome c-type biogenesis protein CcmH/NrfG